MKTKYQWKDKAGRVNLTAQTVGDELEAIRKANGGRLTSESVLKSAVSRKSKLHSAFEWNNNKAGYLYRLEQAAYLIRSIEVVVEVTKGKKKRLRAFVSVVQDEERAYTSLAEAMEDDDLQAQVLAKAWAELQGWRKRYSDLSEFSKVFTIVDKLQLKKAA